MKIFNFINYCLIVLPLVLNSCSENISKSDFDFFLDEPCLILNYEQDNTLEGEYFVVDKINLQNSTVKLKLPNDFYINKSNKSNWIIGWGSSKPLYDAGCENLRLINDINNNVISFGKLMRGNGVPKNGQRIVFWNKNPSGFINKNKKPIIDPSQWPQFAGKSIAFGSVNFDIKLNKWVMIFNECDTSKIQIYAALSDNLVDWIPANYGEPILKPEDFKFSRWAGKDKTNIFDQTPYVSDAINYKGKWFLFLDGYSSDGKRHIGVAISTNTLLGPYKVLEKPLISPGKMGSWNDESCFYAKIKKHNKGFIMFFDGRNKQGFERIGMATSNDLISWMNYDKNPVIDQHSGWSSFIGTTEPNFIDVRKDTILLIISGAKKFKLGPWHHYITSRMYMDKSGNVDDTQLGAYISLDGGKSFTPHKKNPIFTNDYSNFYENEHMGGNFELIKTDSIDYIIYQGKSSYIDSKYNILLREREKTTKSKF